MWPYLNQSLTLNPVYYMSYALNFHNCTVSCLYCMLMKQLYVIKFRKGSIRAGSVGRVFSLHAEGPGLKSERRKAQKTQFTKTGQTLLNEC